MKRFKLFITVIVGCSFLGVITAHRPEHSMNSEHVYVDLAKPTFSRESVAGFLHLSDFESLERHVDELKPRYWRFGNRLSQQQRNQYAEKFVEKGITPILVVSDLMRYQNTKSFKAKSSGGWFKAHEDPDAFVDLVGTNFDQFGGKVVYDVWNEPNTNHFWKGSKQQYFETFKLAHHKIRSMPGGEDALITAPSTAGFDKSFIESFLDYCNKNNLRVDILNWHENGDAKDAQAMEKNIAYAKSHLIKKYPNVGIKEIFIPEIISSKEKYNPLTTLVYLNALERSGGSAGCKACWNSSYEKGGNSCWSNSMDGIINGEGQPRSIWWAYKWYAESLAARIPMESNSPYNVSFAFKPINTDRTINIVLGSFAEGSRVIDVKLSSVQEVFGSARILKAELFKVPNTEHKSLTRPKNISSGRFRVRGGAASIPIKNVDKNAIFMVKIST